MGSQNGSIAKPVGACLGAFRYRIWCDVDRVVRTAGATRILAAGIDPGRPMDGHCRSRFTLPVLIETAGLLDV